MEETKKHTKRSNYHHGDLKTQLIEATRVLVEQKGPDHFSVSEACRVAGVSTAAPYKHFKDKNEMLQEVAVAGMQRQREQMLEEVSVHPRGTLPRIVALGRVYIRFAQKEPGVFRLMFGLSEDHDEHATLSEMGEGTYTAVQQEVAWCRGSEAIEEQDTQRAFLLWSFVHGLSFLLIDGKLAHMNLDFDLEEVLNDVAERVIGPKA
ncbi:TetR/AcrR family transcriptional regulator [Sulfitobacter sp. JB4-11]|uniref:TetR/AcrR family transcriptional regulator n=1 Tax=Sulfitobacter rhodophyticola TaxID=3238304 RepID=UPI0035114C4F